MSWQEAAMDRDRQGPEANAQWEQLVTEVLTGMQEWRVAHPHATLAEIEAAVDERLDGLRARMVEDAAVASRAAQLRELPEAERPRCPDCEQLLVERGRPTRTLTVRGNRQIHLERSYTVCPACGAGHFPPG
jgi:YgiT-type zinc finger domain-containing protein